MKLCFTKLIYVTFKDLYWYICRLLGEQKDYVHYVQ